MGFLSPRALLLELGRSRVAAPAAFLVLALALYGGAVGHEFTLWDDNLYVTENPLVRAPSLAGVLRAFSAPENCNYHPLTTLTYMAEHALVGIDPRLYHLDNVLLHAGAAVLAYWLARAWLGNATAAFAAGLLFLAHPLRVESVAWVAERKDLLCGVFFLAALLAYTAHLDGGRHGGGRFYGLALGLFLLALLSKVMAVTLPAVLLVLLVFRQQATRARLASLLPFAALSVIFAWIGIAAQAGEGAVKSFHGEGIASHLLTVPKALAFYAWKLLLPIGLSPRYCLEAASGLLDAWVLAGLGIATLAAATIFRSWRGRRQAALGLVLFALTWAPVSGLIPTSTVVADRYMYLPAFGLFLVLAAGISRAGARGRAAWIGVAALLGASAFLTPARVAVWRDGETLWMDALRENPRNPHAHNQLAATRLALGKYAEAVGSAVQAVNLGMWRPEFLFNLCLAYRGLGDGEKELAAARGIIEGEPEFMPAWRVVLRHQRQEGKLAECEVLLRRLLAEHPGDPDLLAEAGELEGARGRTEGAILLLLAALEQRSNDPEAFAAAGVYLARAGDCARATAIAETLLAGGSYPPSNWVAERILLLIEALEAGEDARCLESARRLRRLASPGA